MYVFAIAGRSGLAALAVAMFADRCARRAPRAAQALATRVRVR